MKCMAPNIFLYDICTFANNTIAVLLMSVLFCVNKDIIVMHVQSTTLLYALY